MLYIFFNLSGRHSFESEPNILLPTKSLSGY